METDRFDASARSLTAPRSRRGTLALTLGGPLGLLGLHQTAAKKKKKKRSQACPVCPPAAVSPPGPICPARCGFHFHTPDGKIICGNGHQSDLSCDQCETDGDCTFAGAPHCVREFNFAAGGARQTITNQCGDFPHGLCVAVLACKV